MKEREKNNPFDENLFRSMNYELAGEIGAINNEEMKNNEKLSSDKKVKSEKKNK